MTKLNRSFVRIFKKSLIKTSARNMKNISETMVESVRTVIEKQLYKWPPLTEKYAKEKARKGLDPRILIATGKYKDAIKVLREETREDGVTYSVGVEGTFKTTKDGQEVDLPLELLGRWLEFGTTKMPPREHWRPTWSALVRKLPVNTKRLKDEIFKEFNGAVRSSNVYRDRSIGV